MYTLPSGPIAAPFGPPPVSAITSILPFGVTRDSVPRLISTRITLPSGIAIGPSGNCRPEVISRISDMVAPFDSRFDRRHPTAALDAAQGWEKKHAYPDARSACFDYHDDRKIDRRRNPGMRPPRRATFRARA